MEKESLFENSDNKLESALASIMTAEEYSKLSTLLRTSLS